MHSLKQHKTIRRMFDPRSTSLFTLLSNLTVINSCLNDIYLANVNTSSEQDSCEVYVHGKSSFRSSYRNYVLQYIVRLFSFLFNRSQRIDIFVIGSQYFRSNYAHGFSDYDLVIQINCRSISYLNCIYIHLINRLCYALFPFQHHSSFFIFNFFENLSCSPHLPISAFDDVVSLTNHSNYPLRLFNPCGLSYSVNRFTSALSRIKNLISTNSPFMPANDLQYLLALTLIIPTLQLQSMGLAISKKDSFSSPHLSNLVLLESIEYARLNCFQPYRYDYIPLSFFIFLFPRFAILYYQLESLLPFSRHRNITNKTFVYNAVSNYIHGI
jgi:hypothetical protein